MKSINTEKSPIIAFNLFLGRSGTADANAPVIEFENKLDDEMIIVENIRGSRKC